MPEAGSDTPGMPYTEPKGALACYHPSDLPVVKEVTMDDFGGCLTWLLLALGAAIAATLLLYGLGYIL